MLEIPFYQKERAFGEKAARALSQRRIVRHGFETTLISGLHDHEAYLLRQHLVRGVRNSYRHRRPAAPHHHGHLFQGALHGKTTQEDCSSEISFWRPAKSPQGPASTTDKIVKRSSVPRTASSLKACRPSSSPTITFLRTSPNEKRQEHKQIKCSVCLHRPSWGWRDRKRVPQAPASTEFLPPAAYGGISGVSML